MAGTTGENLGELLERKVTRRVLAAMQVCANCGMCAEACHYYVSTGKSETIPAYKALLFREIWLRHRNLLGFRRRNDLSALDKPTMDRLVDAVYGICTGCRRCGMFCPMGIDIGGLIGAGRAVVAHQGAVPKGLQDTVDIHVRSGNNMGITREDYLETLEWLQDELRADLGDPDARIPIDKADARVAYTFNPKEPKFYPLFVLAAARIFHVAGEDWTALSEGWDGTNYALFTNDDPTAALLARRQAEKVEGLNIPTLVSTECGHGFRAIKHEAIRWLGRPLRYTVKSFLEVILEYLQDGRIRLDPTRNRAPVTYHDPCNLVRNGGVVEEPRQLLRRTVLNFVEMQPNREKNFCCGGGGGMLAMTEFATRRIEAGRKKAEQIKTTGAKIVATSCHNCLDQLLEIQKHYRLGVEVKLVVELVNNALVVEPRAGRVAGG